jgi:uncharacterized protein YjaG (DUF416 family)
MPVQACNGIALCLTLQACLCIKQAPNYDMAAINIATGDSN